MSFVEGDSSLKAAIRSHHHVSPSQPTASDASDGMKLANLKINENGEMKSKTFCSQKALDPVKEALLGGKLASQICAHKMFGLLARASGAYHVRETCPWVYIGMHQRFKKLRPGEESDEEETAGYDGGC
jgi:hypothetical protein